jgi:hypothetical protein
VCECVEARERERERQSERECSGNSLEGRGSRSSSYFTYYFQQQQGLYLRRSSSCFTYYFTYYFTYEGAAGTLLTTLSSRSSIYFTQEHQLYY